MMLAGESLGLQGLTTLLSPYSPVTYVFLALMTISIFIISMPDISDESTWLMLVLFTVLALIPDAEKEE